jgi:hypothetical protein
MQELQLDLFHELPFHLLWDPMWLSTQQQQMMTAVLLLIFP